MALIPLKAPYLLALCDATQLEEPNTIFGMAVRLGSQNSAFNLPAADVIHSLIEFSPASESLAIEFLNEFRRLPALEHLVDLVLSGEAGPNAQHCQQWAQNAMEAFHGFAQTLTPQQLALSLKPVVDLTSEYLTHVLIAVRNPGGKPTPQESAVPTPGLPHALANITILIERATRKLNQGALKKLIYLRDGYRCPLTDHPFERQDGVKPVTAYCAHILPFSSKDKAVSLHRLESFTGSRVTAEHIIDNINHPQNAINLESNAHTDFDNMGWGIEAIAGTAEGEIIYRYRKVDPDDNPLIRRNDGEQIFFKNGVNGAMIDGPDPEYCNLHLAISRVLHASGAAEIIAKYLEDDEDFLTLPSYFGGPFVSDEALCRRLDDRLSLHA